MIEQAKNWMKVNASEYEGEEPLFLAIDACAEYNLWNGDDCPGSRSVPCELLEFAEDLILS